MCECLFCSPRLDLIIARENLLTLQNQFANGSIKHGLHTKACRFLGKCQHWEQRMWLDKKAQLLCDPHDFDSSGPDRSKFQKHVLKVFSSRMMILIKSWLVSWTTISWSRKLVIETLSLYMCTCI